MKSDDYFKLLDYVDRGADAFNRYDAVTLLDIAVERIKEIEQAMEKIREATPGLLDEIESIANQANFFKIST